MSTQKKGGATSAYETGLKVAVAREYLTGNLGYVRLARKYSIPLGTVRYFVRWY